MIIITNESNPATLKLLICAAYGKKNVDLKIITSPDAASKGIKHLPLFVFESQKQLFLSNTAARYLFVPPSNYENQTNEWLEWESTLLKPTAVQTLTSAKPDPIMLSTLNTLLQKLNNVTSKFLIGDDVTVCDIAIWTTLYPIYADNALKQKYLASFNNVDIWMSKIEQCLEVKEAFAKYKLTPGLVSLQALLIGDSYMNQPVKENKSDENQKETKVEVNQSSPVRQIELVTADELNSAKQAWLSGTKALPKPKQYSNPVLPISGEKNVLITSALPYVNNVPHLGNIIGCVLSADVFARYCRLCNYNTIFICGTDEYGTATETKALEEGLTPQQICDKYFEIHNTVYRWFGIGFDYFGRTTTPEQTELVQDIFLELNKNGFMETQPVEQLLCQNCDRYLADRFVEGTCPYPECGYEDARGDQCDGCGRLINATELIKPQCKLCRNTPVAKTSYQFFLDLPKLEPILYHWIKKTSSGWSNNAHVIAKSWLREGLKARCITRDLKWGIPVPLDKYRDKVFYVWFDAPIGYMSITKRYTQEWEKWWQPSEDTQVTLYQFMAKDNVPFHTVMFPAVLFGTNRGYTTVNHVMATEYLNYEDGKFSKSRGVGVFGTDALETGIPSDVWRFYLLYMRPESQDSSFNWVDLGTKNNSELLNNLGNFINRGLTFTEKFFNSVIPEMHPAEDDYNLLALCTRELKSYIATLEKAKLRDGIKFILNISRHGNQYVQSTQPWVLIKGSDEDKIRAGTIVGICCNIVCLLATLLHPYMPETSRIIQNQLNSPPSTLILSPEKPEIVQLLPAGHKIGKPVPLFSKIEPERIEELRAKYAGKQQGNANSSLNVSELEAAITKQGEKVRALKQSSGKEVWAPEVAVLLDLKKKLAAASGTSSPSPKKSKKGTSVPVKNSGDNSTAVNSLQNGVSPDDPEVKSLESEIEKQGNLVRNLKTGGASKTEWQPQVNILLDLKNKLASLTGIPLTTGKKNKK